MGYRDGKDKYFLPLLVLAVADLGVFFGSALLAYTVRFSDWFRVHIYDTPVGMLPPVFSEYLALAAYASVIGLLVFERFGFYQRRYGIVRRVHVVSLISAVFVVYTFLMAWLFFYVHSRVQFHSRMVTVLGLFITSGAVAVTHFLFQRVQEFLFDSGIGFERTLVVAAEQDWAAVCNRLAAFYGSAHYVVGVVGVNGGEFPDPAGIPRLGRLAGLDRILIQNRIDRVVLALPPELHREAYAAFQTCRARGLDTRMVPDLFESVTQKLKMGEFQEIPVIPLGETPLAGPSRLAKTVVDTVLAGMLLVISAPLYAFTSAMIKLDSRGPVLYKQQRVGADGRVFTILKFRTMRTGAERTTGPIFALDEDPRCTRVGRFLRRTSLDEVPQLINVLRGEMSLVGPRPERPYFVDKFKQEIPHYMRRHVVKSGMTGLAQIKGFRGNTSISRRTRFDIFYVQKWSFWLDLKILLRTISMSWLRSRSGHPMTPPGSQE